MNFFIKKILFPMVVLTATLLLTSRPKSDPKTITNNYTIKAYKNTVALYNGEELIKTYNNIVLNTLPQKDIYNFKAGVSVTSPEHAEEYLEDFDN